MVLGGMGMMNLLFGLFLVVNCCCMRCGLFFGWVVNMCVVCCIWVLVVCFFVC